MGEASDTSGRDRSSEIQACSDGADNLLVLASSGPNDFSEKGCSSFAELEESDIVEKVEHNISFSCQEFDMKISTSQRIESGSEVKLALLSSLGEELHGTTAEENSNRSRNGGFRDLDVFADIAVKELLLEQCNALTEKDGIGEQKVQVQMLECKSSPHGSSAVPENSLTILIDEVRQCHLQQDDSISMAIDMPEGLSLCPSSTGDLQGLSEHSSLVDNYTAVQCEEHSSLVDNECGEVPTDSKSSSLLVFRRRNPERAASSRTGKKPACLNRPRSGAKNCNKAVDLISLLSDSTINISKDTRKRRTCIMKHANPSHWGSIENLLPSSNLTSEPSESVSHRTWLAMESSKKEPSSRKTPSSVCKRKNINSIKDVPAIGGVYGSNEINLHKVPFLVDSTVAVQTDDKNIRGVGNAAVGKNAHHGDTWLMESTRHQVNRQYLDKEQDSVLTQETISANLQDGCAEEMSCIGTDGKSKEFNARITSDPGSSPDSVVYNPAIEPAHVTSESSEAVNGGPRPPNATFDVELNSAISVQSVVQKQRKPPKSSKKYKKLGAVGQAFDTMDKGMSLPRSSELKELHRTKNYSHGMMDGEYLDTRVHINSVNATATAGVRAGAVDGLEKQQYMPTKSAWVCCDDCHKWRCIPVTLADTLDETKCGWTCKENTDKAFADCSIPQEKTNAEINAELELSDCDDDYSPQTEGDDTCLSQNLVDLDKKSSRPDAWTHIRTNLFLHRNRKTQLIDEVMVCICKAPQNGRKGCQSKCLNRMLNIECTKGSCPCGDLCSNQQFQKRSYAKVRRYSCGNKGYGLKLLEDVSEGQFIIEYVGEVLNLPAYEARQKYYASRGQKHFYFMTLNGGEVIDACLKGNLGRFINHSCTPNCRTEKWMVNGEVCIGLFATREIKKGEELTFDYNYVRVAGAAAQKCFCASPECRGFLGGDPMDSEIVDQGDLFGECNDAVMDGGDAVRDCSIPSTSNTTTDIVTEIMPAVSDKNTCAPLSENSKSGYSLQVRGLQQSEEAICSTVDTCQIDFDLRKNPSLVHDESHAAVVARTSPRPGHKFGRSATSALISKHSEGTKSEAHFDQNRSIDNFNLDGHSKPSPSTGMTETRTHSKSLFGRHDKVSRAVATEHHLGVESELNRLLDSDGGIAKSKDAVYGYLKLLLFITAAEGENDGHPKSVRDLCMLLDAILKTKSHGVLMDIIRKNGSQMLHKILKRNRDIHIRIPVIRKLLKVLVFLVQSLSPELVLREPPCKGMESFTESILKLTRHQDKQVNQIAREFREKWIPIAISKFKPVDRQGSRLVSEQGCGNQSSSMHCCRNPSNQPMSVRATGSLKKFSSDSARTSSTVVNMDRGKLDHQALISAERSVKSTSRWDQAPTTLPRITNDTRKLDPLSKQSAPAPESMNKWDQPPQLSAQTVVKRKRKTRWDQPPADDNCLPYSQTSVCEDEAGANGLKFRRTCVDYSQSNALSLESFDDEVPPGFGPYRTVQKKEFTSMDCSDEAKVPMGYLQEIYQPFVTISYGVPLHHVRQLQQAGEGEGNNSHQTGGVVLGVPFHPFPPLPLYRREKSSFPFKAS